MNTSHIEKLASKGINYEKDSGLLRLNETASFTRSHEGVVAIKSTDSFEIIEANSKDKLTGSIYPLIRAMTANKITDNSTYYPSEELIGDELLGTGIHSWLYPYPRPVLLDHNTNGGLFGGESSPVLGRIKVAGLVEGENFLSLVPEIVDTDAIEKILDGRYLTCSIGVSAESCKCSICGVDQREDWCDHMKGQTYQIKQQNGSYKEEFCYYIIGGVRAREISFVNVPSDNEAMVLVKDLGEAGLKTLTSKKGVITRNESKEPISMELKNALMGWWFVESKQKEYNKMAKKQENTDNSEILEVPANATKPVDFTCVTDILNEAAALVELTKSGEEPDEERVTKLNEAVAKAGFSEDYKIRVVLDDLTGYPALSVNTNLENFKSDTETIKPIIEKVINSDTQVDLTLIESLLLLEELTVDLKTKNKSLESYNIELTEKLNKAEAKLNEETEVNELTKQVEFLTDTSTKLSEAYKDILVRYTATESIRAKRAIAKNRTLDEVVSILATRSESSLLDNLNDLLSENILTTQIPTTELLPNPILGKRAEEDSSSAKVVDINAMLKKLQVNRESSAKNINQEVLTEQEILLGADNILLEESDSEKIEIIFENGMMVIKSAETDSN